ncbi:hypothetical protein IAU60_006844 [Kwoniella sp. DSM 27419]
MVPTVSVVGLIAILSYAHLAVADAFAGCVSVPPDYVQYGINQVLGSQTCSSFCAPYRTQYTYQDTNYCYCSNYGPAAYRQVAVTSGTTCPAGSYKAIRRETTYSWLDCSSNDGGPVSPSITTVQDSTDCFQNCANFRFTLVAPNSQQGTYTCTCTNAFNPGITQASCGPQARFLYIHSPGPEASGMVARRRFIYRDEREHAICPDGKTACSVFAAAESFECIDTTTELESCGGCMWGTYHNATATPGTDCSALRGAALGATTCNQGRCETYACRRGYILVDGACHKRG